MGGDAQSLLTFEELLKATGGKYIGFARSKDVVFSFTSVATDSRNVKEKSLFVPLIGEFQDGHKYIGDALKAGASVVFIEESVYDISPRQYMDLAADNIEKTFIVVEKNLYALQNAARAYVEKFPKLVKIGITGSSGKTTTKEILASVLAQKFNVISTQGNFNSETGLPLSVFNIRAEHQVGVFEMGMNREFEIEELARVLKPNYAIITNIGTAHIGILGSRENIAKEKKNIFNYVAGAAFVPAGDDFADFLSEGVKGKVVRFGRDVAQSFGVDSISDCGIEGTKFSIDGTACQLKLPGKYNFENALSCIALARELGLEPKEIARGIENVKLPEGRSAIEKTKAKNGAEIMIMADCYNANPDSMEKALDFCAALEVKGKKIFVLGDMKELGEKSLAEHTRIVKKSLDCGANEIVFVGNEIESGAKAVKNFGAVKTQFFADAENANLEKICGYILNSAKDGDFVFLKASHSMGFEKIARGIALEAPQKGVA